MLKRPLSLLTIPAAIIALACAGPVAEAESAAEPSEMTSTLETDDQKTLYALGLAMAQNLGQFGLDEAELKLVQQGMSDAVLGRETLVDLQTWGPKIQGLAQARAGQAAAQEKEAAAAFLSEMAAAEGAMTKDSGLIITEMTAGDGASPAATDRVTVHYHGTLRDGSVFDSSVDRGQPATFPLNQVIPCWTEGLQLMKVGGKSKLVCPSDIAYGDQGRPPKIPGGAPLVFEVELLKIEE